MKDKIEKLIQEYEIDLALYNTDLEKGHYQGVMEVLNKLRTLLENQSQDQNPKSNHMKTWGQCCSEVGEKYGFKYAKSVVLFESDSLLAEAAQLFADDKLKSLAEKCTALAKWNKEKSKLEIHKTDAYSRHGQSVAFNFIAYYLEKLINETK